jgi:ubiquinone/menaquinone biosynthesis C-methylase UbiE
MRNRWLIPALVFSSIGLLSGTGWCQEKSVRPGINKPFQDPDVKKFIGAFEGESRELSQKRKEVLAACKIKPGQVVADVGAGTGLFTRLVAAQAGPTGKVFAVDIARKFIDHVLKTCHDQGLNNVVGVVCSQTSTNLPPQSVDVVLIFDTYHHFEFPFKTMQSIHQALKPNGQVILVDFQRIKGKSTDWVMGHVRAGKEVFVNEIVSTGFRVVEEQSFMKENYFVRFVKVKR